MLKKPNRLTQKFEFNITRKYGVYFAAKCFHAYYLVPKNYTGPTKIGFVISNNFDKKAVVRNKIKRWFREAFRHELAKIKGGLWIVIHPKMTTRQKTYEEISADVISFLQKTPLTG